jgi:hypothetical protein
MKDTLSIETERMDDLPLLITHMQRMKLAELLDKHIPVLSTWYIAEQCAIMAS